MCQQVRMSGSSGSNRGRGVGLPRPSTSNGARPAAAAPSSSATVAPLQTTPPRPIIAFQIVQQCQEFLIQLAWQEVRGMATMTTADQKTKLLECYTRFVNLFLQNAIPATNNCYPVCPEALRAGERTASAALLHQSTQTGRANVSKDALHRKAKNGVKKLLKYMGDWARICKDPHTRPGEFTPSAPPSGHDRDWVWTKIKSTEHRSSECLKIWKKRSANRHLAENNDDAVREALTHLNFARRGHSLDEEMNLRGQHEQDNLNEEDAAEYHQIMEEVDAGQVSGVMAESDDETSSTTSRVATQATAAPRGYFETPYCEVQGSYHPFELAAKAFTQYAGNGNEDISAFYTSEWADHQRTQASLGATGRAQQRRIQQAERERDQAGNSTFPVVQSSSTQISAVTAASQLSSSSNHHIDQLTQQMQQQNSNAHHGRILTNLEKAISLAQAMNKPSSVIPGLQQRCLDFLVADINRELPVLTVTNNAAVVFDSSPPIRRRRTQGETQTAAFQQIEALGSVVDNPGGGDCLFYCLAAINNSFVEMRAPRAVRYPLTHMDMRAEVVNTLRADSANVRVALSAPDVGTSQQHAIFADGDMTQQKGSVEDYCDWMQEEGTSGRSVTLALATSLSGA